jgi:hypothetical protein
MLYEDSERGVNMNHYPLPKKGKYLLLLFECEGTVFTTLRRSTPEKMNYYHEKRGMDFELVKT